MFTSYICFLPNGCILMLPSYYCCLLSKGELSLTRIQTPDDIIRIPFFFVFLTCASLEAVLYIKR